MNHAQNQPEGPGYQHPAPHSYGQPFPPPPPSPGRRRHRLRTTVLSVVGVLVLIGAISNLTGGGSKHRPSPAAQAGGPASPATGATGATGAPGSAPGSSGNGSPAAGSAAAATPAAAALTPKQRRFVRAALRRFTAVSGTSDAVMAKVGTDICKARRVGASQSSLIGAARAKLSASASGEMVRLAERDLCPGYLPSPPRVLATFSGSGIETTARFTVGGSGDWKLKWSYDCSGFGDSGNFIVDEDGGSDFSGASVNELGPGGHGSTHVYGDAGSHYLSVDSECSWTVTAVTAS